MASNFEDPDELIQCPYDPVHMVPRKRMPYHIMKCRKNFDQRDYATCPFNARHIVPKREFDDHLRHCTDRHLAEVDIMKEQEDMEREREGTILKGNTSVPSSNFIPESTESWDDENYVVEIKPREGLFAASTSNGQRGREEERPRVPRAKVSNPPDLRMPHGTQGTGSEVYNYSVQRRQEERQLPQQQQTQPQPRVASLGRGRGRGRGRGASASQVGGNPPPGRPGRGAGALKQQQSPPGPPPGFVLPAQGQSPAAVPIGPHLSVDDLTNKRERKLRKMLRQIETLEEKRDRGEPLDGNQEAKILRKNDVLVQLEQIEAQRKKAEQ